MPSGNVTSCAVAPVLTNLISYRPAAGTDMDAGLKPRSNAVIVSVPPGLDTWLTGATAATAAAGLGSGCQVQPGAALASQAAVTATSSTDTAMSRVARRGR